MKTRSNSNRIWIAISILGLALVLAGCKDKGGEAYGQEISSHDVTRLDAVLTKPADFDGKTVTLQGKIIQVCPAGCWFDVKEDSAEIRVDINPSGFAIPQRAGKSVVVEGKISVKDNRPVLIGSGVEIK